MVRNMFRICATYVALSVVILAPFAFSKSRASGERNQLASQGSEIRSHDLTRDNLETAYYGEVNEHVRYLEFAKQADAEGYGQVASMFRAIGRGEEIHAANLALVLERTGSLPSVEMESLAIDSTHNNLAWVLQEQAYEKDDMYPKFMKQAEKESNHEAATVFRRNRAGEAAHLAWCNQALDELETFRGGDVDFYVCTQCGNVVRTVNFDKCPVCGMPGKLFERVR